MHSPNTSARSSLQAPQRVNYHYGQLLDEYHFNLETGYQNGKRWLLNRLVLGRGVVCGLNVRRGNHDDELLVEPGLAIDGWGYEIIVPHRKALRIQLSDVVADDSCQRERHEHSITLWLCYHECLVDPTPTITAECDVERCTPGTIRESYRIEIRRGRHDHWRLPNPGDLVAGGELRHRELVEWVSRCCDAPPEDPCIPLASVRVWHHEGRCGCGDDDIDIMVRPIVFTNRLLAMLLRGEHGVNRASGPHY